MARQLLQMSDVWLHAHRRVHQQVGDSVPLCVPEQRYSQVTHSFRFLKLCKQLVLKEQFTQKSKEIHIFGVSWQVLDLSG